jgi:hypothetical protein
MLAVTGCRTPVLDVPSPPLELAQVNAAVNRQGPVCPHDYCLDDWPAPNDLDRLEYWDCKAYAVAKADRLTHQHGYAPERLEYVLVEGPPLRVTHAALLVDDRWVLDMGLRCQVCELDRFCRRVAHQRTVTDRRLALCASGAAGANAWLLASPYQAKGLAWFSGGIV